MSPFRGIVKTLAIAAYWFLGCYIATFFTDAAYQSALIGMIAGLVTHKRIRDIEEAGGIVPERLVYTLYIPPPVLAVLGLVIGLLPQ